MIVVFVVWADHSVKAKKGKRMDKFLDQAREQRKLWNIKMSVVPNVVKTLWIVRNNIEKKFNKLEIRGRPKTLHTTI